MTKLSLCVRVCVCVRVSFFPLSSFPLNTLQVWLSFASFKSLSEFQKFWSFRMTPTDTLQKNEGKMAPCFFSTSILNRKEERFQRRMKKSEVCDFNRIKSKGGKCHLELSFGQQNIMGWHCLQLDILSTGVIRDVSMASATIKACGLKPPPRAKIFKALCSCTLENTLIQQEHIALFSPLQILLMKGGHTQRHYMEPIFALPHKEYCWWTEELVTD